MLSNNIKNIDNSNRDNQTPKSPTSKSKHKHHHKKNKSDSNSSSNNGRNTKDTTTKDKPNPNFNDFIAENFVLLNVAGRGAFGEIYLSYSLRDSIEVAIKKEKKRPQKPSQLKTEAKIYQTLLSIASNQDVTGTKGLIQSEVQGVPKFYGIGELTNEYYLILEFLGPNLIELFNFCKTRKLSIPCVCLIAIQMINRIENLHKNNYIHRDIKPENFVIGTEEKSNVIYMIDFGLSKRYKNAKNHQHIPYREGRPLTGTARYVSINTHLGIEQSRRDDLESIGYVLVFFLKGSLPWKGLKAGGDKYVRIMEKKLQIPTEILCYGLPDEMVLYLNYCKSLRFEDRPDYDYLRGLFIGLLSTCSTTFGLTKDALKFDWCYEDPATGVWNMYKTRDSTIPEKKIQKIFSIGNMNKYLEQNSLDFAKSNSPTNNSAKIKINRELNRELTKIDETPVGGDSTVLHKNSNSNKLGNNQSENNSNRNVLSVFQKTNENNPNYTIDSSDYSDSKQKKKDKNKDGSFKENIPIDSSKISGSSGSKTSSEETIILDFQGVNYIDKIKHNLTEEEIKNITDYFNAEDIDSYISKILKLSSRKKSKTKETTDEKENFSNNKTSKEVREEDKQSYTIMDNKNGIKENKDDDDDDDSSSGFYSPIIGAKDNKKELKDSIEINKSIISLKEMSKKGDSNSPSPTSVSRKYYRSQKNKNIQTSINSKHVLSLIKGNNDENKNGVLSDSDSSGIAEKNPTLLSNTMKNSRIGLSENETKNLQEIVTKKANNIRENGKYPTMILLDHKINKNIDLSENVAKMSKQNIMIHNKIQNKKMKEQNCVSNSNGEIKSFETETIPKICSSEIKERRKSRILEMNNFPIDNMKFHKENFIKIKKEPLIKYYSVLGDLGSGSYGQVKKVKNRKLKEFRAMKIVKKKSESSQNEIEILRKISHPNIVNIYEIFEDSKKFYIMSELMEGGELFEAISSKGFFRESDACFIMHQILKAVNYLHNMNIVHRDLKPENIMLVSKSKFEVKIIDFGTAKFFEKGSKLSKFIGTSYYLAPEVIKENYDEKCDVWSCGVILYILLCGYPPFNGASNAQIYYNIQNSILSFKGDEWKEVSKEAIELIKSMLIKEPHCRISAAGALTHKWFKEYGYDNAGNNSSSQINTGIKEEKQLKAITKMANFVIENRLKQAVLQFISTQFNIKKEEENLRDVFKQFDVEKKGLITKEIFLQELIKLYGENDAQLITDKIFTQLDRDGSGEISYNEFLTALIDDKKVVTLDRLDRAFKLFDKDGNGKLNIEEIKQAFGGDEKAWKKVIRDVDKNNDGEVDFEEFKLLMMGLEQKNFFEENK